jgi:hypothetical protein
VAEHPLDGAQRKIERAWEHRQALRREIKEFDATNPYWLEAVPESKPGHYAARLRAGGEPPIRLSIIAGEMAYEYISALNHIAWGLAAKKLGRKKALEERAKIQFPIGLTPAKFRKQKVVKEALVSRRAIKVMRELQPYTGPDGEDGAPKHSLWLMKELADSDKHRVLAPRVSSLMFREWEWAWEKPRKGEAFSITKVLRPGQRLYEGKVLGRIAFADGSAREKVDVHHADIPIDVLFETEAYMLGMHDFGNARAFMTRALRELAPLFPPRPDADA